MQKWPHRLRRGAVASGGIHDIGSDECRGSTNRDARRKAKAHGTMLIARRIGGLGRYFCICSAGAVADSGRVQRSLLLRAALQ
jgi:hypothetical protein